MRGVDWFASHFGGILSDCLRFYYPVFAPEVSTPPSPVTFSGGTNLSLGKTSTAIKDISAVLTRKTVEGLKDTSGTLLATLRKAKVDIPSSSTSSPRGSSDADRMGDYGDGTPGEEAAEQALSGLVPALVREQAFITDLFEMDGRNDAPEKAAKRDVKWQRRMAETMDRLVPSLLPELLALIDVAARKDPTSSLGILVVLEKHCTAVAGSAQRSPWMLSVLQKAMERARESFVTFCEQQAGIIEGTKLLTRKKLGILDFTRTFPVFADRIEALLALNPQAPLDPPPLSRQCAATAYDLLSRTIFDSLDNISRQVERMQRLEEDEGRRYGGKITGAAGEEDAVVVHVLHVRECQLGMDGLETVLTLLTTSIQKTCTTSTLSSVSARFPPSSPWLSAPRPSTTTTCQHTQRWSCGVRSDGYRSSLMVSKRWSATAERRRWPSDRHTAKPCCETSSRSIPDERWVG